MNGRLRWLFALCMLWTLAPNGSAVGFTNYFDAALGINSYPSGDETFRLSAKETLAIQTDLGPAILIKGDLSLFLPAEFRPGIGVGIVFSHLPFSYSELSYGIQFPEESDPIHNIYSDITFEQSWGYITLRNTVFLGSEVDDLLALAATFYLGRFVTLKPVFFFLFDAAMENELTLRVDSDFTLFDRLTLTVGAGAVIHGGVIDGSNEDTEPSILPQLGLGVSYRFSDSFTLSYSFGFSRLPTHEQSTHGLGLILRW